MIYFVSDIHLGCVDKEQSLRAERAFCRWLDTIGKDAEAIYLLGDVFDFWFEYRRVVPHGFVRVLGRLAELSDRGVEIVLYAGNHDMWCRDYLTRECGIRVEPKPKVEVIAGRKVHLAHGDNLNVKGKPMLKLMNAIFRSGLLRWMFRWFIHPDFSMWLGHKFSGSSRKSHGNEPLPVSALDFLVEYAAKHHAKNGDVETYIFGHMHIPHRHVADDMEVLFLSDWDRSEATYIAMDADNIELRSFAID